MKTQPLHQISGELTFTSELKLPQASLSSETKRILYLLAACIALMMTGYGMVMPVFAKRIGELGSGLQALGLLTMSFAFAQFLLSPFMGSFADRFGRRPLILIALAGEVVANGAYLYAQSVPLYIAIRFFQGGISAGLLPATLGVVGDRVPEKQRAQWTGVIMASYAAGFIFGPALGGVLFDHWGYAAPFAVSGILALLALVLAVVMVPETRPASTPVQKLKPIAGQTGLRAMWHSWPRPIYLFATLLLIDFIATFAFAFIEPQMVLYFYNQLLLTPTQLGLIYGGYGLATLLGQAFLGKLSDRHGRKPVILLGLLLTGTLYLGLIIVTSFGLLFTVAVLSGLGDALFIPAIAASSLDIAEPEHLSRVMGIKGSVAALAGVAGPLLVAIVSPWTASANIFAISAGVTLIAILLALVVLKGRSNINSRKEQVQTIPSSQRERQ
jgi:MFS family permease